MPFTPSHAVVALPLLRTPLVPAAVAIGAMTPDLPLFIRGFGVSYAFTHAPLNLLWTGLIALGLFLLWRIVLRAVLPELVPDWLRRRLPDDWRMPVPAAARQAVGVGGPRRYRLMLALSLVIGILTHIVWDAFTHEGRWGSMLLPALAEQWGAMPGYRWLQHGSSIVGLLLIGLWALRWVLRRSPVDVGERRMPSWLGWVWLLSLPLFLLTAALIVRAQRGPLTTEFSLAHLAYAAFPFASGLWGLATIALCALIAWLLSRMPAPLAPEAAENRG